MKMECYRELSLSGRYWRILYVDSERWWIEVVRAVNPPSGSVRNSRGRLLPDYDYRWIKSMIQNATSSDESESSSISDI